MLFSFLIRLCLSTDLIVRNNIMTLLISARIRIFFQTAPCNAQFHKVIDGPLEIIAISSTCFSEFRYGIGLSSSLQLRCLRLRSNPVRPSVSHTYAAHGTAPSSDLYGKGCSPTEFASSWESRLRSGIRFWQMAKANSAWCLGGMHWGILQTRR